MSEESARQEAFEERAAIMEFCGGLSRLEAEVMAKKEQPKTKSPDPPPMPAESKTTPGYLAFREFWHTKPTITNRRKP